jgi:flavin-dependent dehydrogenase
VADAIDTTRLPSRRIHAARFVDASGGRSVTVPLGGDARDVLDGPDVLIVASRAEFDGLLLDAARDAGAQLVAMRATDIVRSPDGFVIDAGSRRIAARRLIGADGPNSLVRRRLARPFARADLSIATGYFAHAAASAASDVSPERPVSPVNNDIVIELAADPPGYLWSFPRPGHLAVGICAQADAGATAGDLRSRTARWIDRLGLADNARLEPYSWPIPSLSAAAFRSLTVAGTEWFLAGDAAGLVDPITREGIYFALRSGELAAQAALTSGAAHLRYREQVHDEITADLAIAARYKAGFFRPRFARLLIDALTESAGVRAVMADLVAGRRAYSSLKWSLAGTFEVGLAWRLLTAS